MILETTLPCTSTPTRRASLGVVVLIAWDARFRKKLQSLQALRAFSRESDLGLIWALQGHLGSAPHGSAAKQALPPTGAAITSLALSEARPRAKGLTHHARMHVTYLHICIYTFADIHMCITTYAYKNKKNVYIHMQAKIQAHQPE